MATTGRAIGRVAIVCLSVAIAGAVLWWAGAAQGGFLGAAVRSGTFVKCGLVVLGSVLMLAVITGVLLRSGRAGRQVRSGGLGSDSDGTAVVEFTLLFPIAMGVVLVMIQAMLMMTATVLVNYAAFAAARTAIVWIPKDTSGQLPTGYDPEPENLVNPPPRSYKLFMIHAAAATACLPVSGTSSSGAAGAPAIRAGITKYYQQMSAKPPNWVDSLVDGQFAYAWNHTRIVLEDWVAPPGQANSYASDQDVSVWVYHDFNLTMPFASALFAQGKSADGYISTISAHCTLNNEGVSDVIKEDKFN